MLRPSFRQLVERVFGEADIQIDGTRPWDIRVSDDRFYRRAITQGSIGIGEAYMEGWWDCDALDELAVRVLRVSASEKLFGGLTHLLSKIRAFSFDLQKGVGSKKVAAVHYDLPPDLFEAMLGPTMNYSCAYWRNAKDLDSAQFAKMALIGTKLKLKPGMRLLDIGCGWGGFAAFASEQLGCSVHGVTVSPEQATYASAKCQRLDVKIDCLDYRELSGAEHGRFDAISSIGMLEHVGPRNYRRLFEKTAALLQPAGLMLIQTFGRERSQPVDGWVNKYIFPNSYVPSATELCRAKGDYFVMEDWHNFGADYDQTLMAWAAKFESWAQERWKKTDRARYRMWRYYLLTFAAGFRARDRAQLWQIVYSPSGVSGGYQSIR